MRGKKPARHSDAVDAAHLSESDFRKLMEYVRCRADHAREKGGTRACVDELIILLLAGAGLRAGEVCNLRIGDLPASRGEDTLSVRDDTGKVTRTIDLDAETASRLKRFARLYRRDARPDDPVLVSERGTPLAYMSIYSKVRNIGQKAKIGRLYPQMLRRSFMVRLYNAERDLRFVQIQAGHARPATTAMYAKPAARHQDSSGGQSGAAKSGPPTLGEAEAAGSQDLVGARFACEACGGYIPADAGIRIDSGQLLCIACLNELRGEVS